MPKAYDGPEFNLGILETLRFRVQGCLPVIDPFDTLDYNTK